MHRHFKEAVLLKGAKNILYNYYFLSYVLLGREVNHRSDTIKNNNDAIHHLDKLGSNQALAFDLFTSKARHLVFKPRGFDFEPHPTKTYSVSCTIFPMLLLAKWNQGRIGCLAPP